MTLMYFLVNIHINNQSILYKVKTVASDAIVVTPQIFKGFLVTF
jgi:hypothetical protein